MGQSRAGVNVIIPNKLVQRAQIYTWMLDVKSSWLKQNGITAVVNFWPKTDPDVSNLDLDWYWQISCPGSDMMLLPHIWAAADGVCSYMTLPRKTVLVLCEAGKTRSVFFCILVWKRLYKCSYEEAMKAVTDKIGSVELKGFMKDWLANEDRPRGLL